MQTRFDPAQLEDPGVARSEKAIRKCVHCGFCTATCPTYVLLGDENDSPRGRIYLIKEMLENGRPADEKTVKHVDRCLSCLSCMTTCPSGVHYAHLVDHARAHIEDTYKRPLPERLHRSLIATVLPRPWLFRLALIGATLARPFRGLFPKRLRVMLDLAPEGSKQPAPDTPPLDVPATPRMRIALLPGCVQQVLSPEINAAAARVLARAGVEVSDTPGPSCCGSLTHHLGKERPARAAARRAIDAWIAEMDGPGLDAVVITTSGCGTTIKDYPALFDDDPEYREKAARVATIAKDVTEVLADVGLPAARTKDAAGLRVAYHAACSLQHGQAVRSAPSALLREAGYEVVAPAESHLCCGSAGSYNMLQPEIANQLRERKAANVARTNPKVLATGNIGCLMQIGSAIEAPAVHTVELLDWATGGPKPPALAEV